MQITKHNGKRQQFVRIEFGILEAEKLGLFSMKAKDVALKNIKKEEFEFIKNPKFSKERFFVIRGKVGETSECYSCYKDKDNEDWNYCPNCGTEFDEVETINNSYRSIEKAIKDEYYTELGVTDIYVVFIDSIDKK